MVEIIREDGETIDRMVRRYNEKLKRLNFFEKVKKSRVYTKKSTKRQRKVSALYKERKRTKMDYLKRIGKLEDQTFNGKFSRGYS